MFQFLFKYPLPVFTKGRFALLGGPAWLLVLLIVVSATALAVLIRRRLHEAAPNLRGWRAWSAWSLQSLLIGLLLLLVWQPVMTVAELSSRQNIIAVVIDDSRSMAIADSDGRTREAAALASLQAGLLTGLQKRFQTRLYRLDAGLTRTDTSSTIIPTGRATHIGDGLKQLATETSDLPVGAVVLLTDGGENMAGLGGSGIGADALQALRNRHLPVHVAGFGREEHSHDVEVEDVSVPAGSVANARMSATVSFTQRGYSGQKATVTVREGDRTIAARQVTLGGNGALQTEPLYFPAGAAGAKTLRFAVEPLAGEENLANNSVTRPLLVSEVKRRILYVEGEPRWEFKFIRRAEDLDSTVQMVSMLRTSENKIYRQGIDQPGELADGFPVRAEDLFGYSGIIIGSVDADYFSPLQQELLREYVDRRGGGVLFLGGRSALADGGWAASSLSQLLPTFLPSGRGSFHRNAATVQLTSAGIDSPVTRLLDDPAQNAARWKRLTYLADYEEPGSPKPGATVLADMNAGGRKLPLLITQSYGHGRTVILGHRGHLALADERSPGGPSARPLLAAASALAGRGLAWSGRRLRARAYAHGSGPGTSFRPGARPRVSTLPQRARDGAHRRDPREPTRWSTFALTREPGLYEAEWTAEKPGAISPRSAPMLPANSHKLSAAMSSPFSARTV